MIKILAVSLMISATAVHAEPLDAKKLGTFCSHLGWWKQIKCGYYAGGSLALLTRADKFDLLAKHETDPNEAAKLRNKAAFERLEAERYADEYRRKYAPK